MATITLKLCTPQVPNFIRVQNPPGRRQDGFKPEEGIDVKDLTPEQLNNIADEWRTALFANAEKRRKP